MGKSASSEFFKNHGATIIDTDIIARDVVQPGEPALNRIPNEFGGKVFSEDGSLDRKKLAALMFSDPGKKTALEAIVHPIIRQRWHEKVEALRTAEVPLAIVVIPLLFETSAEKECEKIICTACTEKTQIVRLSARGWD